MSMRLIVPSIDHRPASRLVGEPSAPHPQHQPSTHREPPASTPTIVEGGAAVRSASPPHRRRAAALIRQLGGRTEAELRRELDRFFAARPDLSDADRTPIARAMARFRNQLLHLPRSSLLAAAAADGPAVAPTLLDAVRRLFGLADAPHGRHTGPRTPEDRSRDHRPARLLPDRSYPDETARTDKMLLTTHTSARRRGIVLVLILGVLALMAVIGVAFATFSGQS